MSTPAYNVLVVEDDPGVLKALRRKLTQAGHAVSTATNCEAGRALTAQFDLAILDLELPDGSGVELAEELLARSQAVQVVFYTGAADRLLLARAGRLGLIVNKNQSVEDMLQIAYQALNPPVSERHETGRWRVAERRREQSR